MSQLIGDELGIDAGLTRQTGMRASHDLKGSPWESNRFEARQNEPPPSAVTAQGCADRCGREDPCVGICRRALLPPLLEEDARAGRQGDVSLGPLTLRPIELASVKPM